MHSILERELCAGEAQHHMNQRSFILNKEYHLIERLLVLREGRSMILCEDTAGSRYLCSEDTWKSGAPEECIPAPKVTTDSSAHDKISLFLSLFRGREDVYAKRYFNTKTEKSGYVPACQNEWLIGVCDKRSYKCPVCPNRAFRSLTEDIVKTHLLGRDNLCRDVVGIYPMLEGDQTYLLAADFDEQDWQLDVAAFRETCLDYGLTPAVERSRSGQGAHVWFFFSESIPAANARRLGSGLLTRTMECRHELAFKSYDRLFPSQDTVPKGGFGNLIALPFQGQAQKNGNSLFVDERFLPYTDQWAFISTLPKITPEQLDECLSGLCTDGETGILTEDTQQPTWPTHRRRDRLTHDDFPIQARLMKRHRGYCYYAILI